MKAKEARETITENDILFIEDNKFSREQIVDNLHDQGYHNIIAPTNADECTEIILSKRPAHAVIDLDLKEWVGANKNNPIIIGEFECFDGIQLIEVLQFYNYNIQTGLYSAHRPDLIRRAESLAKLSSVEILDEQKGLGFPFKHIFDYVERLNRFEIITKPLHKIAGKLPSEIQSFYAKKILNSLKSGEYIWKAGEYSWLVGVNYDISSRYAEIESSENYTADKPEEKFIITNKRDLNVVSFLDESGYTNYNFGNIPPDETALTPERLNNTQNICKKYLTREITADTAVSLFVKLGEYAMFESQKILFKDLSRNLIASRKEDVYEILKPFSSNRFPKILDIYKCRVDFIEDGIAHVKLESFSPENVVRVERFGAEFLKNHHIIDNNSQFEYTIYTPFIGGSAYHLEPI